MDYNIKRGDIFWADVNTCNASPFKGIRPVIIIQNDIGNKYSFSVIIAIITSQIYKAKLPTHVELDKDECELRKNSVILLEQIYTIDKMMLKDKIGTVSSNTIKKVDEALNISLGSNIFTEKTKIQELENYISQLSKPVVITEGKSDVRLMESAWNKLYPNTIMPFDCTASGIESDEEKRTGNADSVRRTIEYMANIVDRPIIGLFDNDIEGNQKFKGLNNVVFEPYDITKIVRKHKSKNVWGVLLPVPDGRELFVTGDDITQRYLVIEHYFFNDILKQHSMYGSNILGTSVFHVNNKKDAFSKEIENLDAKEFRNFKILFELIKHIFNIK